MLGQIITLTSSIRTINIEIIMVYKDNKLPPFRRYKDGIVYGIDMGFIFWCHNRETVAKHIHQVLT